MNDSLRPLFHFTAPHGWLNDPNGLIYHNGLWHLFYQHNPQGTEWGNMTWGHAVSTDLIHWEHWPSALEPYKDGTIFSGSAVSVEGVLHAFYTFAGKPFDQRLALSEDGGRTFTQYAWNPVLPHIEGENRDPRVFWYAPAEHWCMAVYVRRQESDGIEFYTSENLTDWSFASRIEGFYECPECFEIDGTWVLFGADGVYVLGQFDGRTFVPDSPRLHLDEGPNFYAAQTWTDAPRLRRVLIAWMRGGKYPNQVFNQQMTFPTELTLCEVRGQRRLCRQPVPEIEAVWRAAWEVGQVALVPGCGLQSVWESQSFDIDAELRVEPDKALVLRVRGADIHYDARSGLLSCLGHGGTLPLVEGRLRLRVLCDRTSLEVFGGTGELAISICFLPEPTALTCCFSAPAGGVVVERATVRLI